MIILKTLKWSNVFSYGKDNEIALDENQITQILGSNGHGKSSIPLILEEVLFNKNSKGIKRGDVLNRFSNEKKYLISLEFEKITEIGTEKYLIETVRSSTQSVSLSKFVDGKYENISAHTSTATYKEIESILGFSHDVFVSLIYQSSAQSMEFLVATDTTRKKFLIELLGLTRYTEAFEVFKTLAKEVSSEVLEAETKVSTIQRWLDKNAKIDLNRGEILEVPEEPRDLSEALGQISIELKNIEDTNKVIIKNNQYKQYLDAIVLEPKVERPEDATALVKEKTELEVAKRNAEAEIKNAKTLKDTCPTCKQSVDISFVPDLIKGKEEIVLTAATKLKQIQTALDQHAVDTKKYLSAEKSKQDFEMYSALHNVEISSELKDKDVLENKIKEIRTNIFNIELTIREARENNARVSAKNAQIDVIIEQSASMSSELYDVSKELVVLSDRLATLEILKKAFSTNGLLAYKIECLVKDLEEITNSYLGELSDGRFQLSFVVTNDKLNVVINDNGSDVDISALSSGERSRVNTATLLAIRKLMQALSATRVNLLILDETIDALDVYGKEKLVEVLLNEQGLNTFLISHSFSHPLMEKLTVIKTDNISRIE